jgi:D-sedoheptulose 7-phosphate isomerase
MGSMTSLLVTDPVQEFVEQELWQSCKVKQKLVDDVALTRMVQTVAEACVAVYRQGGKTLIAGNGGSASDAQHMAAELSGRFHIDRPGLPSLSLTANVTTLTAIGNDYGYDQIFSRQLQADGVKGDLFFGISTSGNSKNILRALQVCREKGITSVGLTGKSGGRMVDLCDYCIQVPSSSTPRIQECHILILHTICGVVEASLFGQL